MLLTAEQVAELLSVKLSWVRYASREGVLPSIKLGKHRRYRREAIEEWLREKEGE